MSYTFFVSYYDGNEKCQLGIPQAFKCENNTIYILLFLEEYQGKSKLEWIRADSCRCLGIVDLYSLQEIMKRDRITLLDLEIIRDFKSKFTSKVT
jgi:hypothetical protein